MSIKQALEACGIERGESFQLASILDRKIRCATFTSTGKARAWAEAQGARNIYICGNPVRPDLGPNRAKATDVTRVACMLVDIDPDGDDEAPLKVAHGIAALLALKQPRPSVIDSGRGAQVWVQLEPDVDRRARLHQIAEKFGQPGVKFDATHDPARLMRLPGYVNQKTGRKASFA